MILKGLENEEEVTEDMLDFFERLSESPLKINLVSERHLRNSMLFDEYRVRVISDYIKEKGEILSLYEFSMIDGIGMRFAYAVKPFVSFEKRTSDERVKTLFSDDKKKPLRGEILLKGAVKSDLARKARDFKFTGKTKFYDNSNYSGIISYTRKSHVISSSNNVCGGHVVYYGKRFLNRLVAGNFNLQYGHGISVWTGFNLNTAPKASAFYRRGRGVIPSASENSPVGAACEINVGRRNLMSFVSAYDATSGTLLVVADWKITGKRFSLSFSDFSCCDSKRIFHNRLSSALSYTCTRGTILFSEFAVDLKTAGFCGLTGIVFPVTEKFKVASSVMFFQKNIYAGYSPLLSRGIKKGNRFRYNLCADYTTFSHYFCFSCDGTTNMPSGNGPLKVSGEYKGSVSEAVSCSLKLSYALPESLVYMRSGHNVRLRGRTIFSRNIFYSSFMADVSVVKKNCFLLFSEMGLKSGFLSVFIHGQYYNIPSWDDRIYVYQRDVRGNFSVPAFFGRGYLCAINLNVKFTVAKVRMKLDFHSSLQRSYYKSKKNDKVILNFSLLSSF